MTTRERFRAVMNFEPFDRLPVVEWVPWWDETTARWHREGLPASITDRYDMYRHFGLEVYYQDWFRGQSSTCPPPPKHLAGVVSNMDDYERIREHLYPWPVIDHEMWRRWSAEQKRGDAVIWFTLEGFFWFPRRLFGVEQHMYAFYDQPELIHRINSDLCAHSEKIIDELFKHYTPDFMTFAEDMSYNHGPMLSKPIFDEFLKPYYERIVPKLKAHGVIPFIDSDGDVTVLWQWLEPAGLEGILPLERQAGVDVAQLRREHPRLRMIGAFDKMVMNKGEAAIRAEFERLLPTCRTGGLIISTDHQPPPGVSLDNYQLYLKLFREYAGKV